MSVERELTAWERREIRKLVKGLYASYDSDYGCLPLECDCVMLHKWWTGGGCKYFREYVLPANKALEASVNNKKVKRCAVCGKAYQSDSNNAKYCEVCAKAVIRKQKAKYARKRRSKVEK